MDFVLNLKMVSHSKEVTESMKEKTHASYEEETTVRV